MRIEGLAVLSLILITLIVSLAVATPGNGNNTGNRTLDHLNANESNDDLNETGNDFDDDLNETENETEIECPNLFYIDNESKSCEKKKFCGVYMYEGLQTFENKSDCFAAAGIENKTKIKSCPNGTEQENESCMYRLSNGRKGEIKIMPSTASERAIQRLGELGFNVQLKEVGSQNGTKVAYELTAEKEGKMLGLFKTKGKVKAYVDSETGEITKIKKPWWSFLASGI